MIKRKAGLLDNTLSDERFNAAAAAVARRAHLRVSVEICNYTDQPITCIKANDVAHEINPITDIDVGRSLVIKITTVARRDLVKINAGEDYSEEYLPATYLRYKAHCSYRVTREENGRQNSSEIVAFMIFDARQLFSLDNRLTISEIGMDIRVGRYSNEVKGTWTALRDTLTPSLVPNNDKRPSGFVINGVDPDYKFDKMFYRIGENIFEVDIDRSPEERPGVFIAFWNRINDIDDAVRQDIVTMTLEEAMAGKNPSGIRIYPSMVDAILDKGEVNKTKAATEERHNDEWESKEQKAKVSHTWVKIAADFLKNVLPAAVTIAKAAITLLGKIKKVPI